MLMEQTLRKLKELGLHGMLKSYEERIIKPDYRDLSFSDFFGILVDDEYLYRQNARQKRLLSQAHLKISSASIEDIDYRHTRGLNKTEVLNLQNEEWLKKHYNILITGPTGVGKTYLACAFGSWACRNGWTVLYYRWPRLLGDMLSAKGEGNYLRHLNKLGKTGLLIIDDFGINALTDMEKKDFLEIIEDRYMSGSTIITSQLPLKEWHEYINEPTIADAVCDRLFHIAYTFELKGTSMRKKAC